MLYRHNAAIGTHWNMFFGDNSLYLDDSDQGHAEDEGEAAPVGRQHGLRLKQGFRGRTNSNQTFKTALAMKEEFSKAK